MCPAHVAKSHFTDIAVSGRFPYSYAYRATQTAMKKPPANVKIVCERRCDEGVRFFKDNVCGTIRTIDGGGTRE